MEPLPVQAAILVSYVPRGLALGLSRWREGGKILSASTQTAPTHLVDLTLIQDGRSQSPLNILPSVTQGARSRRSY